MSSKKLIERCDSWQGFATAAVAGSAAWGPLSISTFRSFHWNESFSLEKVLPHSSLEPGTGCQHCRERGGGFSTLSREASLALLSGGTPAPQSCMISSETWRMHPNVLLDVVLRTKGRLGSLAAL